jgi:hypothetical protein
MEKIELGTFIHQVKRELIEAQCKNETPFYELEEVELEMDFVIDTSVEAKGKLFIVDVGGQISKTKSHRIKLKLRPIGNTKSAVSKDEKNDIDANKDLNSYGGGYSDSFESRHDKYSGIVYSPDK